MDSIIEVQRQTHEEIERFERALYTLLSRNLISHELKLQNEHKASQILDRISTRTAALKNLYEDVDARQAEIDSLSAPGQQSDLTEFYSRLVKIQEHHAKYPDSVAGGPNLEIEALLEEPNQDGYEEYEEDPISLLFSGEEAYGKYLDLYAHHVAYTNLKSIGKRPGYLQYLDLLIGSQNGPVHQELPKEARFTKDFETYIRGLHTYLLSFIKKTQPLLDVGTLQNEARVEFEKRWDAGELKEWEDGSDKKAQNDAPSGIWCSACQKHYSKQTVFDAHLTSKKHIKAAEKQAESSAVPVNPNGPKQTSAPSQPSNTKNRLRDSALYTHLSNSLLVTLLPILNDTKSNVERKFSLTAREREQELMEQSKPQPAPAATTANGDEAEEEEEEERIYNPLKLPLGWDGKPIPYWLYKLHGLGVEYRCEICSDHVYMGRKNFDRHFQESRHAFGMRALGLPNTKHFHEITRIEDALALAEKLKQEGRHEVFEQETMEELEDDEGNVYNRKTYEDLKKQGLI
ncbi:rna splicing factor prp9 [Moniliophthora roreri MCA 2997]|uniref:Rna splicing factor prp9 n=2 Tax=Moniliophthora roreri TaxID=221103 RepID=V2XL43_MONRO|nr:rna splicing factor prp9 [Moniliophthora roreri MCA 2997]KAI3612239.1 rna splicing factor prp9 [Moniliophthora roreri]